jgi:hypothetical protein
VPTKRPTSGVSIPHYPFKKMKFDRDGSLAEAAKFGTIDDFAFFDKVAVVTKKVQVGMPSINRFVEGWQLL